MNSNLRNELYKAICERLSAVEEIKHIDLWNHNMEFLEQESNWPMPAVFIEFAPVRWTALVNGREYRSEPIVRLHVVTEWPGDATPGSETLDNALEAFNLCGAIHRELCCLSGESFQCLDLVESHTNHNHEEIVENIEVYNCAGYISMGI